MQAGRLATMTSDTRRGALRLGASPTIRTANKALIVREGRLLVTVNNHDGTEFYLLPGGGQEWGEDRVAGLRRECSEELGCDVEVNGLAFLRTYIGAHHRRAETDGWFHQEEAYWWCTLADDADAAAGTLVDQWQTGVAWKTVAELRASGEFSPCPLLTWLELPAPSRPLYLGDCF